MNNIFKKQRVRRLDSVLAGVHLPQRPPNGWIKEIRQLLGVPERVLGRVLKIDQSTIARLEKSEAAETISMKRLSEIANAMNCELRYVLVPRIPLQQFIREQALKSARKTLKSVDRSMSLEDQKTSSKELEQQIQDLADELVAKGDSSIWEDL